MPNTTSLAFPNLFDVARNTFAVVEDNASIVNRTRLLMLTEPTEIYNEPTQGVGLKRYLWQYNTENTKAMIRDRIVNQLREHEPYVTAENTQFADGLLFTGSSDPVDIHQDYNQLKMTVALETTYGGSVSISFDNTEVTNNG